ncbi:hypothetical protein [Desulfobulbus propionicus]
MGLLEEKGKVERLQTFNRFRADDLKKKAFLVNSCIIGDCLLAKSRISGFWKLKFLLSGKRNFFEENFDFPEISAKRNKD